MILLILALSCNNNTSDTSDTEYDALLSDMTLDEKIEFCEDYEPISTYCSSSIKVNGDKYVYHYPVEVECQTGWTVNDCELTLGDMKSCFDVIWFDPCTSIFPVECVGMMGCTFDYGEE